jgi:negative regulator of sigma E activity
VTDPLPPLTDEELSAVADGEAGPEVVGRVEADPAAQARVDAFAAAGTALRSAPVTPLDPATVDRLVARSIEEAGRAEPGPAGGAGDADGSDADSSDVVAAPVTPTAGRIARAPRWLVAAAVVALVAAGLGLIWSGQQGGDDQVATTGTDAATDAATEAPSETSDEAPGEDGAPAPDDAARGDTAGEDGSASEAPDGNGAGDAPGGAPVPHAEVPSTTAGAGAGAAAEITDLGDFASPDELRERLRTDFPDDLPLTSGSAPETPSTGTVERCRNQVQQVFEIETMPTATGLAIIDDQPVLVYEFEAPSFADGSPTTLVAGVGPDACSSVLTFER